MPFAILPAKPAMVLQLIIAYLAIQLSIEPSLPQLVSALMVIFRMLRVYVGHAIPHVQLALLWMPVAPVLPVKIPPSILLLESADALVEDTLIIQRINAKLVIIPVLLAQQPV